MMDNNELTAYENIYSEIKETLLQSRKQAYTSVIALQHMKKFYVLLTWKIEGGTDG